MTNTGLQKAIQAAGSQTELAKRLGKYPQLIQSWTKNGVPPKWAGAVERVTGVPRHELRPDIFDAPNGLQTNAE